MLSRLAIAFVLAAAAAAPSAQAAVHELAPDQAVVLPDDETGVAKVALQFDLSGIPEGHVIDLGYLDWSLTGVSDSERSEYAILLVTSSWTEAGVSGGAAPDVEEASFGTWDIEPRDYGRTAGLVRFALTDLAREWSSGETDNFGVVVSTEHLSGNALATQLENATLVLHTHHETE